MRQKPVIFQCSYYCQGWYNQSGQSGFGLTNISFFIYTKDCKVSIVAFILIYTVYVNSFEGENFCGSSLKLNMWGKLFIVENIVLCSKSKNNLYAWLISLWCVRIRRLSFNMCTMVEERREFETDSFVCGYHVFWALVIGEQLVCERKEENPRDRYAVAIKNVVIWYLPRVT